MKRIACRGRILASLVQDNNFYLGDPVILVLGKKKDKKFRGKKDLYPVSRTRVEK